MHRSSCRWHRPGFEDGPQVDGVVGLVVVIGLARSDDVADDDYHRESSLKYGFSQPYQIVGVVVRNRFIVITCFG